MLPGDCDDWLICMISTQIRQCVPLFDEIIEEKDSDFIQSGLKTASVIRLGRLAVVHSSLLHGVIGNISSERLHRIRTVMAEWLLQV